MPFRFVSLYRIFNFLSFDVALGACAGMYFFANMFRLKLAFPSYLLMAVSVWVIYTFDHLLDAHFIKSHHISPRHYFHQRNFKILLSFLIIAAVFALILAVFILPSTWILVSGVILASLILFNMMVIQHFKRQLAAWKEISIAVFYVLGISLLPVLESEYSHIDLRWLYFSAGYILLAWFNLVLLSSLDQESDKQTGQESIVSKLGHEKVRGLLQWLGIIGICYFLSLLFLLPSYYHVYTTLLLLIFIWHIRFLLEPKKNAEVARKRLELSFSFPWILLILT